MFIVRGVLFYAVASVHVASTAASLAASLIAPAATMSA
jgi:hypothetical protein